jgi:hypothetical protein
LAGEAHASQLIEEFGDAEAQYYGPGAGGKTDWLQQKNRELLDQIDGAWVSLNQIELKDADALTKACAKPRFKFAAINRYSFARIWTFGTEEAHDIYMWKAGLSYNIRRDTDAYIRDNHKKESAPSDELETGDQPYLKSANQEAVLMMISPNVLLEINGGMEQLYGRCEK